MRCNFKVFYSTSGKYKQVFYLEVICRRCGDRKLYYTVEGMSFDTCGGVALSKGTLFSNTHDTPEEAFAFAEKIAAKYPRYDDERDDDINLAPVYSGDDL